MAKLRAQKSDVLWGCLNLSNGDDVSLDGDTYEDTVHRIVAYIVDYCTSDIGDEANVLVVRGKEEYHLDSLKKIKRYFYQNK